MAARSSAFARWCRTATPTSSSATSRSRSVLVDFSASPPGITTTDRDTSSCPVSSRTSDHRSAHNSPRRMPVSAASIRSGASRGSRTSAASMMLLTASVDGGRSLRWATRGGFASSATFCRTQPQRSAWWSAEETVAWRFLIVFGALPASRIVPYRSSRCLAVRWLAWIPPSWGRRTRSTWDRYERMVVGERSIRSHSDQPAVEQLAEGDTQPVGSIGRLAVDQLPDESIRRPGRAVERPSERLLRAGDGIPAHVDADLPHARGTLALRSPHGPNGRSNGWSGRILGIRPGISPREPEEPSPRRGL